MNFVRTGSVDWKENLLNSFDSNAFLVRWQAFFMFNVYYQHREKSWGYINDKSSSISEKLSLCLMYFFNDNQKRRERLNTSCLLTFLWHSCIPVVLHRKSAEVTRAFLRRDLNRFHQLKLLLVIAVSKICYCLSVFIKFKGFVKKGNKNWLIFVAELPGISYGKCHRQWKFFSSIQFMIKIYC